MKTYAVTATRWEHGWELEIEDVGTTQARNLAEAEAVAADYVALMEDAAVDEVTITLDIVVDGSIEKMAAEVRREIEGLARQQEKVAQDSREVARRLKDAGLTGADAARVMRVSPQRFSQLTADDVKYVYRRSAAKGTTRIPAGRLGRTG